MNKRLGFTSIAFLATCLSATAGTYKPQFQVDYAKCDPKYLPVVSGNSVQFGSGLQCHAGRVVSTKRYKNITKVTATIDLSALQQNYVNAAFYMVENNVHPEKQPILKDYCDSGTAPDNHNEWNCREIDFLETNGNKIFQTTMHLGDGGGKAPQRYEWAYTSAANNSCFNWGAMRDDPQLGLHSLSGNYPSSPPDLDVSKPFTITTEFTYNPPSMKTTLTQTREFTIYDTLKDGGGEGSAKLDYSDLNKTMGQGYWIIVSFWQGWSPEGPGIGNNKWWNNSCAWGGLCNSSGLYWSISNIVVTAESEVP